MKQKQIFTMFYIRSLSILALTIFAAELNGLRYYNQAKTACQSNSQSISRTRSPSILATTDYHYRYQDAADHSAFLQEQFLRSTARDNYQRNDVYKSRQARCGARVNVKTSSTKLNSLSKISLDTSVIPSTRFPLDKFYILLLSLFAMVKLMKTNVLSNLINIVSSLKIPMPWSAKSKIKTVSSSVEVDKTQIESSRFQKLLEIFRNIRIKENLNTICLYIVHNMKSIVHKAKSLLGNSEDFIEKNEWNVCTVMSKKDITEDFYKIKFKIPDAPSAQLKLGLGQELTICASDANGNVLKQSTFPVAVSKGAFEIIGSNFDDFATILDSLEMGDNLGFKFGQYRLNYKGPVDPINSMTLVASGIGITAALTIVREVLTDSDNTISTMDLLWINEKKSDFILNNQVEAIELKHIDNCFVTRVVDAELTNAETKINPKVQNAVSPVDNNRIAIYAGPSIIEGKSLEFLEELGYRREDVVSILME